MKDQKKLWNNAHSDGDIQYYSQIPTDFALSSLSYLKPNSTLLELGCGVGNDSIAFAKANHTVLATDFSDVAIEKARQRFKEISNLRFEVLDMSKPFQLQHSTFDAVYARLSLHYFNERETKRIFSDIYKVLKPKGFLFFMCKSTNDSLYGKGEKIEDNMFEEKGHIRHFFSIEYVYECLQGRFEVIKLEEKTDLLYGKPSAFIEVVGQKI